MTSTVTDWPEGTPPGQALNDLPHIAIIGKMGSGKTTCAQILRRELNYTIGSFATKLKQVAQIIWGESVAFDRGKLQALGVKVRDIDDEAWVNALQADLLAWTGPIVVDDCRFQNEYWALKHLGYKFIRVTAPEALREDRLMRNGKLQSRAQLTHISETDLDDLPADSEILNATTEDYLMDGLLRRVELFKKQVI